jgi:hypothetical protein
VWVSAPQALLEPSFDNTRGASFIRTEFRWHESESASDNDPVPAARLKIVARGKKTDGEATGFGDGFGYG